MTVQVREWEERDVVAMTAIWNDVIAAGRYFPNTDILTEDEMRAMADQQSFTGVAVNNWSMENDSVERGLAHGAAHDGRMRSTQTHDERAQEAQSHVGHAQEAQSYDGRAQSMQTRNGRAQSMQTHAGHAQLGRSGHAQSAHVRDISNGQDAVGLYILHPNGIGRCAHIANCGYMVAASARGAGVGRQLVIHSLEKAAELGFNGVQFNAVVASNLGAIALYESLGFRRIGTVPGAYMTDAGPQDTHIYFHEV